MQTFMNQNKIFRNLSYIKLDQKMQTFMNQNKFFNQHHSHTSYIHLWTTNKLSTPITSIQLLQPTKDQHLGRSKKFHTFNLAFSFDVLSFCLLWSLRRCLFNLENAPTIKTFRKSYKGRGRKKRAYLENAPTKWPNFSRYAFYISLSFPLGNLY